MAEASIKAVNTAVNAMVFLMASPCGLKYFSRGDAQGAPPLPAGGGPAFLIPVTRDRPPARPHAGRAVRTLICASKPYLPGTGGTPPPWHSVQLSWAVMPNCLTLATAWWDGL
ncbi:MAG: hypothetical protein Kow0025_11200 [Thermodesulfovibrionales bacterium]